MENQDFNALAEGLRAKEAEYDLRIPEGQWIVVRVDGRGFSALTERHFQKPFDLAFHSVMENTARSLLEGLQGSYAYTGSDEISLILPPTWNLFDRRVEKLVSLSASCASVAFVRSSSNLPGQFDSRVSVFSSIQEVYDYCIWRQKDVRRCSLQTLCYWTLRGEGMSARRATAALNAVARLDKEGMLRMRSIIFEEIPAWQRLGVGLWWETYQKVGFDPVKQQEVQAQRRRVSVREVLPERDAYEAWLKQLLEGEA